MLQQSDLELCVAISAAVKFIEPVGVVGLVGVDGLAGVVGLAAVDGLVELVGAGLVGSTTVP